MSNCQLDHSTEDVKKKLEDQKPFLPEDLYIESNQLLERKPNQLILNELFHVLKKYDLASEEEKSKRNENLKQLTESIS